jgi:GTP-binding protein Era
MIVIGKKGEKIKQIGIRARLKIQKLLGKNTHLDLRVKVTPQWASKKTIVNKFGYEER